ncbi:MAG: tocopherol cyclase family protein [Saprospiraceae bacterium]
MNLLKRIRSTWHPNEYHGWGRTQRYFEGWYYKIVTPAEDLAMAFIPGIAMSPEGERHAFVQVMDGTHCRADYHRFESSDFRPATDHFALEVGRNFFSGEKMTLDLPGVQGELQFRNPVVWPKMLGAPGIMGWYSFVPFMECSHGIVSMGHTLEGKLEIVSPQTGKTQLVDFTGGKGYIEKDWGRSFPKAYVWMQSNHFAGTEQASLMASVAHIPWLHSHFVGFISGLWLEGRLFRFATYTGAKKYLEVGTDTATLIFKNPHTELRILARHGPGSALVFPISGEMTGKINESLQATLEVELLENGRRIFADTGRNAGLELAGEVREVLAG